MSQAARVVPYQGGGWPEHADALHDAVGRVDGSKLRPALSLHVGVPCSGTVSQSCVGVSSHVEAAVLSAVYFACGGGLIPAPDEFVPGGQGAFMGVDQEPVHAPSGEELLKMLCSVVYGNRNAMVALNRLPALRLRLEQVGVVRGVCTTLVQYTFF